MKTILLTGKNGQIGWELQRTLQPLGKVVALDSRQLNLADFDAVRRIVREISPDIIVNPAAYTNVDLAESEPELAKAVNSTAPGILAEEADRLGARLVHYSTDYVFDGSKLVPYSETDEPNPLNVYGRTKLAGEEAVRAVAGDYLILRTSWVYGTRGRNFLLTMLQLAKEQDELRVVDDQIGAPTWSRMIAEVTAQILAELQTPRKVTSEEFSGIYHLAASGAVSWRGFAKMIFELLRVDPCPRLTAITSSEFPTPAHRPMNSCLSDEKFSKTFGLAVGDWQENLKLCLESFAF